MIVLAWLLMVVNVLIVVISLGISYRRCINTDGFFGLIQKLVMANNIDRAIKLCNYKPKTFVANMIKHLLVHANRVHEIDLCCEEAQMTLKALNPLKDTLGWSGLLVAFFTQLIFLANVTNLFSYKYSWIIFVVTILSNVVSMYIYRKIKHNIDSGLIYIIQLRNLLLARRHMVLKHRQPRMMTAEEVKEWRARMDAFTKEMAETPKTQRAHSVEEEYRRRADDDGVLPEL
ncbi:hypothetical protein A2239_00040 [Candidatus Uhrbacteria bacterium RIFOXYA2_FULL_40_9]|nr:MAG: Biopolymer transport protein [Candidatus Uhrbacteria bacterium GW2011_GWF2_40_263]OGL93471.1 MAG: hypothetical protein A2239_00040 [Candidatus Uhrbacteria bacterium RIFOXYA2_FULL_40_9]OGL97371.1 MAG: hypothetical protein A2332_04600 [Candidatus Uhrbacteria bacterium RIFOXYB2_FULL_41_18]HBK35041.1 hypothetical protein [Candidatus Uhrbacteria bacterium]HCB56194.1 hypothetical protein [Candidatus Uhrbacteria bacterium]